MKPFIALSALTAAAMAAPAAQVAGPVHAAVGDLVATKRGFRPVSLEGFSEDDNQDGFVDPVGQVAPIVHHAPYVAAAPLTYAHAAPYLHAPLAYHAAPLAAAVKIEAPKVEKVEVPAAPVVSYHAAPLAYHGLHHTYAAPLTHITHHPVSYTQTIPLGVHRQVVTTHHVAGLPIVAAAAPAAEAEAEVVEA